MTLPVLIALSTVFVLAAVLASVVLVRRRRCARLCRRFAAAATTGRFDDADLIARRWFDAAGWTGLRRRPVPAAALGDRLRRLVARRSRSHARTQSRADTRRRSVT